MQSSCFKLIITALIIIQIAEIPYQRRLYLEPEPQYGNALMR